MMKKLTALMLTLCLLLPCAALADTAFGRLNQRIATRSGPGTDYFEPGSFLKQGDYVTVHTKVWDAVNEIWWVQVEFTSGYDTYRAYTGAWRMSVDLTDVPEERPLGIVRVTSDADVFAGPGWDYVMWNDTVCRGTSAVLLEVEAGYAHIECWNDRWNQPWRVWAPLRNLSCSGEYTSLDDTYPSNSGYTGSNGYTAKRISANVAWQVRHDDISVVLMHDWNVNTLKVSGKHSAGTEKTLIILFSASMTFGWTDQTYIIRLHQIRYLNMLT